jgi:hypothetical protein
MNARKSSAISTFSFQSARTPTTIPTTTSAASATRRTVCLMQGFSPVQRFRKRQETGFAR